MVDRLTAYLRLATAMTLVGSSVVAAKMLTTTVPPAIAGAGRFLLAGCLMVPLLLILQPLPHLQRRDWAIILLQGFAGIFLFYLLLQLGLRWTTATAAGVITGTTPAVTAILGALVLGERPTRRQWLGIACAAAGAIIASVPTAASGGTTASGSAPLLGNLLIFGAVCGEACFTLGSKLVSDRATPLFNATAVSMIGLAFFLPFALVEARNFDFTSVPVGSWLVVAYTGAFVTVIAFVLWFGGVSRVPASIAAGFTGILPTSAILLAALVLHEPLTPFHLLGGGSVLLGLFFLTQPQRPLTA